MFFRVLNINCSFILNKNLFNSWFEVLVLKKEIVKLKVFFQETWDYNPTDA